MKLFDKVLTNIQQKEQEKKRLKKIREEQALEFAFLIFKWCEQGIPYAAMEKLEIEDEFQYLMNHLEHNRHYIDDDSYESLIRAVNMRQLNRQREEIQRELVKMSHGQKVLKLTPVNEEYENTL